MQFHAAVRQQLNEREAELHELSACCVLMIIKLLTESSSSALTETDENFLYSYYFYDSLSSLHHNSSYSDKACNRDVCMKKNNLF